MRGTLTTACLPDLLRTIYTDRRTGILVLVQGDVRKQVFFELGQIVFASSTRNEDRIGETLVRHGKLTREQLNIVLGALTPGQHLGNFLVEQGALNPRELISYVNFQIIDIIYSLFSWTVGVYEFAEGDAYLAPEDLKLRFSTATVILEGVRRIEDHEVIRRGLGDLNRLLVPTDIPLLRLQSIVLKPIEQRILELVKQPVDIIKVLISVHETPLKTLKALYGLLSIGLLRQGESAELSATTGKMVASEALQQKAAAALPAEYTVRTTEQMNIPAELLNPEVTASQAPLASLQAQAPQPLDLDRVKRDIALIKDRVSTQDARVIFGLSPDPSQEEVQNSYYRLATKFHPDKFIEAPRQVREDIDYIFANLTKLYNRLQVELPGANLVPASSLASSSTNLPRPTGISGPPTISSPPAGIAPRPQAAMSNSSANMPRPNIISPQSYSSSPYQASAQSSPYQIPSQSASEYQIPSEYQVPSQSSYQPPKYSPSSYQNPNQGPAIPPSYLQPSFVPPSNQPNRGNDNFSYQPNLAPRPLPKGTVAARVGKVDLEGALNDLFEYLEDRKAPLIVSDSLTSLFKTRPPIYIERTSLIEAIVSWARQKVGFTGHSVNEVFLSVISAIRHAEQARVIQDFDPNQFYGAFIQELARYCPPNEAENFMSKAAEL